MTTLNTPYGYSCMTCGARPTEPCRAVVRKDTGHGQQVKEPHRARRDVANPLEWHGRYYPTPAFAAATGERVRRKLGEVWDA